MAPLDHRQILCCVFNLFRDWSTSERNKLSHLPKSWLCYSRKVIRGLLNVTKCMIAPHTFCLIVLVQSQLILTLMQMCIENWELCDEWTYTYVTSMYIICTYCIHLWLRDASVPSLHLNSLMWCKWCSTKQPRWCRGPVGMAAHSHRQWHLTVLSGNGGRVQMRKRTTDGEKVKSSQTGWNTENGGRLRFWPSVLQLLRSITLLTEASTHSTADDAWYI